MTNLQPLINGKSYEWSDIKLNIMGVAISGITNIEYGEKQDMINNFGAGRRPVSRGYGKIEATAKITLYMEEVENLQSIVPSGLLQDIPEFDIIVAYLDTALIPRNHTIRNVRFMDNGRTTNQGEQFISVELNLLPSHIEWV